MADHPNKNPVVAAIPGGGWRCEYREDDGTIASYPIVAWMIQADGECSAIDTDALGECGDPSKVSNFVRLYHPDEEPAVPAEEQQPAGG